MTIEKLLEFPETYMQWEQPWPGKSASGAPLDASVTLRATISDCIKMQRYENDKLFPDKDALNDKELLLDFMATNWAYALKEFE